MGVKELSLRDLVTLSFLLATEIALARVVPVINTPIAKISFGFIPIVLVAVLYKPTVTMIFCGLADFIGAILFPIGPYYPVFTLTAIISGAILGFGFYKKELTFLRILSVVVIGTLICSVLLNTFWISILFKKVFWALLSTRSVAGLVKIAVKVVVIYALKNASVFDRIIKIKERTA